MALSVAEKRSIRRALCNKRASARVIAVIDSGSADTLSGLVERSIGTAFAGKRRATAIIANLESGTATTAATEKHLAYAIGRARTAAGICDEIDTLT